MQDTRGAMHCSELAGIPVGGVSRLKHLAHRSTPSKPACPHSDAGPFEPGKELESVTCNESVTELWSRLE